VVADDDALSEGLVDGHGEPSSQLGLSEEEEAKTVLGVHLVVGEETEVFEDVGAEVVCLVDDEDGSAAGLGDEAGDFGSDLPEEGSAGAFDGEAHLPGIVLKRSMTFPVEANVDDAVERGVGGRGPSGARSPLPRRR
jgi:hypothetical protein